MSDLFAALDQKIKLGYFSGACLIYGDTNGIKDEIYAGQISLGSKNRVTENTLFDIQSISKVVATCPVLLKLSEQRTLDLDSPVSRWLPQFQEGDKSAITLEHLARYTAGFSDYDLSFEFQSVVEEWEKMLQSPIHAKPGSKIDYADLSYRILGKAIETCTGESLDQLAKKLLWEPLGMSKTCYNPSPTSFREIASTCLTTGLVDDKEDAFLGGIVGCDGVFSTGRDLATYCQMILHSGKGTSGISLKKSSIEHMLTPTTAKTLENPSSWFETLAYGPKTMGWEKGLPGFSYSGKDSKSIIEKAGGGGSFVWLDVSEGTFFVYLTNHGRPDPFTDKSWNELVGKLAPHIISRTIHE